MTPATYGGGGQEGASGLQRKQKLGHAAWPSPAAAPTATLPLHSRVTPSGSRDCGLWLWVAQPPHADEQVSLPSLC